MRKLKKLLNKIILLLIVVFIFSFKVNALTTSEPYVKAFLECNNDNISLDDEAETSCSIRWVAYAEPETINEEYTVEIVLGDKTGTFYQTFTSSNKKNSFVIPSYTNSSSSDVEIQGGNNFLTYLSLNKTVPYTTVSESICITGNVIISEPCKTFNITKTSSESSSIDKSDSQVSIECDSNDLINNTNILCSVYVNPLFSNEGEVLKRITTSLNINSALSISNITPNTTLGFSQTSAESSTNTYSFNTSLNTLNSNTKYKIFSFNLAKSSSAASSSNLSTIIGISSVIINEANLEKSSQSLVGTGLTIQYKESTTGESTSNTDNSNSDNISSTNTDNSSSQDSSQSVSGNPNTGAFIDWTIIIIVIIFAIFNVYQAKKHNKFYKL